MNALFSEITPEDAWRSWHLDKITPVAIILFTVWTIYVQLLSLIHGNFTTLIRFLPLAVAMAIGTSFAWSILSRRVQSDSVIRVCNSRQYINPSRWVVLSAAVCWVVIYACLRNCIFFWWGAVAGLAAAYLHLVRSTSESEDLPHVLGRRGSLLLILLCTFAAVITLVSNRPDIDDSLYLSIPATLLHSPNQPILLHDTLYRLPNLPIVLAVYREHTYEVLIGAISYITGVAPIKVADLFLPPLAAILAAIAWAQVLRILAPRSWLHGLVVLVLCMLVLGEAQHAYGNFAFVRLFQGKAILLCWGIPAVMYSALAYMRTGRVVDWLVLCASQIACIGLTSTGLFVAPLAAVIAMVSVWSPSAASSRGLATGILASWYVAIVGLLLAFAAAHHFGEMGSISLPSFEEVIYGTFGYLSILPLLVALLAAWAFCESEFAARALAGMALLFLMCFNPYIYGWLMHHDNIMSISVFWRLTWVVPLPIMLAILLYKLFIFCVDGRQPWIKAGVSVITIALIIWCANGVGTLRTANGVVLGVPRVKAPPNDYTLAQALANNLPESSVLLAPVSVAVWCSTFIRHPLLLAVRPMYLLFTTQQLGKDEVARRYDLQLYVSGWKRDPGSAQLLKDGISRYHLRTVVVTRAAPWASEIGTVLSAEGFHASANGNYVVWRENR